MRSLLRMVLKRDFFIFVASERRSRIRHYEHTRKMGGFKTELKASASGICQWRYFEAGKKKHTLKNKSHKMYASKKIHLAGNVNPWQWYLATVNRLPGYDQFKPKYVEVSLMFKITYAH